MRNLGWIFLSSLLLFGCHSAPWRAVWVPSYMVDSVGTIEPIYGKAFMDLKDHRLIAITELLRDGKHKVETVSLSVKRSSDSTFYITEKGSPDWVEFVLRGDRLITVDPINFGQKVIMRRIDEVATSAHKLEPLLGSFLFSGSDFRDSLDFISDTLVLSTGWFNQRHPVRRWTIVKYKDYSFVTFEGIDWPLLQITGYSKDSVELKSYSGETREFDLTRTRSEIKPSQLLGTWKEIRSPFPKPPPPPGVSIESQYLCMKIDSDSITYNPYGRTGKFKWKLSNDGKRIYFPDKIHEESGSLKLVGLTQDTLTLRISNWNNSIYIDLLKEE